MSTAIAIDGSHECPIHGPYNCGIPDCRIAHGYPCPTCVASRKSPQPAPDAEGEWKTFGRIVHHPIRDERGDSVDRFQLQVENTNGLLEPGEAERIAARIARDHSAVPKLIEALKGVAIMLNTELERYESEPWAQRVRAALADSDTQGKQ